METLIHRDREGRRYEDMRSGQDRRAPTPQKKWTFERWALLITMCTSMVAFTFGLGVNWADIKRLQADQAAAAQIYLRGDVYVSDQRALREAIERLSKVVERMEAREDRVREERERPPLPAFGRQ